MSETPLNRRNPESWVGQTIGITLKMMGPRGNVSMDAKLLVNGDDVIIVRAKTVDAKGNIIGEQEMHVERNNIVLTTLACESAVQVVGAGALYQIVNGRGH